jgi:hypothetical protein
MFFGVDHALGADAMAAAKAGAGVDMVWVAQGTGSLSQTWVDQCFDWTHDFLNGVQQSDPYNLKSVTGFYADVAKSSKRAFGSMVAGFNGTLTKSVAWSKGKYLPRGSAACMVSWAHTIDGVIPPNVTRMQWATWSDWEEGSEIESGVKNDVTVSAGVQGGSLTWTTTSGSGDESTIDHYEIYASQDGILATDLGAVAVGTHTFDVRSVRELIGAPLQLYVNAVGKPTVRDHLSPAAPF